jgi:hypothetical protein
MSKGDAWRVLQSEGMKSNVNELRASEFPPGDEPRFAAALVAPTVEPVFGCAAAGLEVHSSRGLWYRSYRFGTFRTMPQRWDLPGRALHP